MADKKENLIGQVKSFFQTKQGRMVSVGAATGILVVTLIIIFTTILKGGGSEHKVKVVDNTKAKPAAATNNQSANLSSSATTPTDSSSSGEDIDLNSNFEVYQTRDPFKPINKATTASVSLPVSSPTPTTNASGTANSTTTPAPAKLPLLLESITSRDGINFAVIKYGTASYELKSGDQVGSSPYQVQQVGNDNVTLLYGDDQFTLNVGQEVYK